MPAAESKVPAVTLAFWVVKIVATTLGEVGGNAVTLTLGLGYLAGTAIFGTALGDWMADSTGLGYNGSALVIAAALAVAAALCFFTAASRTLLFWAAFILTRPLGATVANSLDKPAAAGGQPFEVAAAISRLAA